MIEKTTNRPPPRKGGGSKAGRRARSAAAFRTQPKSTVIAFVAAAALIAGLLLTALVFFLAGGRWFIVATPSMGESAPVGSLVLTVPAHIPDIQPGTVITFHPPTAPGEVYTHRVQGESGDGQLTTRGDINGGTDPWTISQGDLIGRSILLPGLGWLVRALPILLIGTGLLWLLTRLYSRDSWRAPLRITGVPLVVALAAFILKPFVGVIVLTTNASADGANARVVSTGLLPIRVQAAGGSHADLISGAVAQVSVPSLSEEGFYQLSSALHLSLPGWITLATVCSLPLLWCLIVGLPPAPPKRVDHP